MLATILSGAFVGVDAYIVQVEVDISDGFSAFSTVGLLDSAIRKSKGRAIAAIKNSNYHFPTNRITVNLEPAYDRILKVSRTIAGLWKQTDSAQPCLGNDSISRSGLRYLVKIKSRSTNATLHYPSCGS